MNISQSIIKAVLPQDACGKAFKFRYVDGIETPPSELMMRGKYFEHHLIGASRGGEVPELTKLKGGGKSQAEKDLDELILWAKNIFNELGIDMAAAQVQVKLEANGLEGHLDMITNDIQNPARQAIYDVKYTETKQDDRWNGWADFDMRHNEKIQACQYIKLFHAMFGHWIPYYFLVFGKSFWCRVIKVVVTKESMVVHDLKIQQTIDKIEDWKKNDYPANPEFNKCGACYYIDKCKNVATTPTIETFEI